MLRSTVKVGAATTDWSHTVLDERHYPAMGGAGWARIGQVKAASRNHWVAGRLLPIHGRSGAARDLRLAVTTWDRVTHADCPVIVLQRYMDDDVVALVRTARANGQIVINDLDDWFWGLHPENRAYRDTSPDLNERSNIEHYRHTLLASSAVVTSTRFLADRVNEWNPRLRVECIPNGIAVDRFPTRRHRAGPTTIGWVGSTAHRSGDLALLRKPFAGLDKKVGFHHTGHHHDFPSFAQQAGVSAERVSTTPMLAPYEYPYGFLFDVGVVPLVDIPFNHAKSNIKGLEYAAAGIPFVASPLPEYVILAEEYGVGRLAKTARDWQRHLKALLDYEVRRDESRRQRHIVAEHFTVRKQAQAWDNLMWDLIG